MSSNTTTFIIESATVPLVTSRSFSFESLIKKFLAFTFALFILAGCVERKMIVRLDPPDARLSIDGVEVPPLEPGSNERHQAFVFHGTHRLTLRARGFAPLETHWEIEPRWFSIFPVDIFTELLWPGTIEDIRSLRLKLAPTATASSEARSELVDRALDMGTEADVDLR